MRVISGEAKGRKLLEPKGWEIRPTTDMVKESIFNIIQFNVEGSRVLDLFAGTGQLGIEALSRGAEEAVFTDESAAAVKLVEENLKKTGLSGKSVVFRGESLNFIGRTGCFDIIFLDPPYHTGLIESALARIIEIDILKENGIIICETQSDRILPEVPAPYGKSREYRYGKIKITVYEKNPDRRYEV